ncbi:Fic family protein [Olsenella phocaeensis]|uniref:Fic family protein n=1 Tax=Olsenella phocaeensis TaxID=1852385 RepID=UPI0026DC11D6|nr:Fic family protein [uncultured Olsenella sp.]
MSYRSLEKIFYADASSDRFAHNARLARERLEADSTFRTSLLTPNGELFLATPRELSVLNERVMRNERAVSAAMGALPPVASAALVRSLVIDEVVSTNELEGVHSTRRQVSDALDLELSMDDPSRDRRFREFAKLYLDLSDHDRGYPSSPEDVRRVYDLVMRGEDMHGVVPDGRLFRAGGVEIIGANQKVLHVGIEPEEKIIEAIARMIELADRKDMPQTFSAIIAHYYFEYIHPFYDGNGRTGRYLLALYLSRPLSTLTSLSLSRVIAENRAAYYKSFKQAESPLNHGELTFFVWNLLENILVAQEQIVDDLTQKRTALEEASKLLSQVVSERGLSEQEASVLFMLIQLQLFATFPGTSLAEVASHSNVSQQQARKYTKRLEELGLMVTTRRRPLRFELSEEVKSLL